MMKRKKSVNIRKLKILLKTLAIFFKIKILSKTLANPKKIQNFLSKNICKSVFSVNFYATRVKKIRFYGYNIRIYEA